MSLLISPRFTGPMSRHGISHAALFDGSTGYLSNVLATTGDRQKFTIAGWAFVPVDDGAPSRMIYTSYSGAGWTGFGLFAGSNGHRWRFVQNTSGYDFHIYFDAVARDCTGWVPFKLTVDTTQANAEDRAVLEVNGTTVPHQTSEPNYIAVPLNTSTYINVATTQTHYVGTITPSSNFWDGGLAELIVVDGPGTVEHTEIDPVTGNVVAKAPVVSAYGANGFYLGFSNDANLGEDQSGNGNDFTVNGTVTQVTSTPTNVYATINALTPISVSLTNGNRSLNGVAAQFYLIRDTLSATDGKYYSETLAFGNRTGCGSAVARAISDVSPDYPGRTTDSVGTYCSTGGVWTVGLAGASHVNTGITAGVGDRSLAAFDTATGKAWAGIYDASTTTTYWYDSTGAATGDPATGANPTYTFAPGEALTFATSTYDSTSETIHYTEEADWVLTPPAGFKALGTDNLPKVNDSVGNHFVTDLDTGANIETTAKANFTDYVTWIKDRDNANNHQVMDTVRGPTAVLQTNTTAAETTYTAPAGNSVAWTWNLPSSETNTSGTVGVDWKYNATSGVAVGTYNGNGIAGATLGLPTINGEAPKFFVIKSTSASGGWYVYHNALGATRYLILHDAAAAATSSGPFNDTEPTSSLITLGSGTSTNASGVDFVIYAFWETDFIKIGSYEGNASSGGPCLNETISPVWSLIKEVDTANRGWFVQDAVRSPFNPVDLTLAPNTSNAESSGTDLLDCLASGMKLRHDGSVRSVNEASTHIYMMIGQPTGGRNVAPATAR